ncbi:MAG: fumarate hydratase class I [Chloroflexi bacterium]|nr:MAG: fumarate hydratase class I [Chloroflexota bacterium]MBA4376659.1 fumarate hydrolyase [Anaerolinea sp.]
MNDQITRRLSLPISNDGILDLHVGDPILLSGVIITGRDAVHKWLFDTFINKTRLPEGDDLKVYNAMKSILDGGVLYHCGPVVSRLDNGEYQFIAAGPTTSMREEPYQAEIMRNFNLKGVIGKGGMGAKTLAACHEVPAVYFHAVGGAAALIAETVKSVLSVHKLEFGAPEAIWVIEVIDFPVVVTMDAHGFSLHAEVRARSRDMLEKLIKS